MILSKNDISRAICNQDLNIYPFKKKHMQPASYDLTLGSTFLKFNSSPLLDIRKEPEMEKIIKKDTIILPPQSFILGTTQEEVSIGAGYCARVDGRSSIGRYGILVHSTAGFIDPGFKGKITLEITNQNRDHSIEIDIGRRICQIVFEKLSSKSDVLYGDPSLGSKYQGQSCTTPSRAYSDYVAR